MRSETTHVTSLREASRVLNHRFSDVQRLSKSGKITKAPEGWRLSAIAHGIISTAREPAKLSAEIHGCAKAEAGSGAYDQHRRWRLVYEEARAREKAIAAARAEGSVVPEAEVREALARIGASERGDWLSWGQRVGPMLSKTPPERITIELDRAIREHLAHRGETAGREGN